MRKKVLIIIASVVGAAIITGGVVGALYAFNHGAPKPAAKVAAFDPTKGHSNSDPTLQESQTTPDLSTDLGACSIVTQGSIEAGLGMKTQAADNRGYGHEGSGDISQSCVYALSADNSASNRITVTVTKFASQDNATMAASGYTTATKVANLGDAAYFTSQLGDTGLKQDQYELVVFKDLKSYDFVILQPVPGDAYSESSAQAALTAIAKTASF
jgi:hypothetical protein